MSRYRWRGTGLKQILNKCCSVRYQLSKISRLIVTTNDYGSFEQLCYTVKLLTGSFQFAISMEIEFSVEGIAAFQGNFDTIKSNYKLGESVAVQGRTLLCRKSNQ